MNCKNGGWELKSSEEEPEKLKGNEGQRRKSHKLGKTVKKYEEA